MCTLGWHVVYFHQMKSDSLIDHKAFSTLRALALTRSYPLAVFVFCLSIVPIPVNLVGPSTCPGISGLPPATITNVAGQSEFCKGVTGLVIPLIGCAEDDNVSSNLLTMYLSRLSAHVRASLALCLDVGILVPYAPAFPIGLTCSPVTITSRASLITADLLLVYITWVNLYRRGPTLQHILRINGFIAVCLRDGMCA